MVKYDPCRDRDRAGDLKIDTHLIKTQQDMGEPRESSGTGTSVSAAIAGGPMAIMDASLLVILFAILPLEHTPGLRYLLQYPYGCIEQTSSSLLPLVRLGPLLPVELQIEHVVQHDAGHVKQRGGGHQE